MKRELDADGQWYYGIQVWDNISDSGMLYCWADTVRVANDGAVFFVRIRDGEERVNLVLTAGSWKAVFVAGTLAGGPLTTEHWVIPERPPSLAKQKAAPKGGPHAADLR
jgi:hypothetical protein